MFVAVLDVNVIVSALADAHGVPRAVVNAGISEDYELILSTHIQDGVGRASLKPYFHGRIDYTKAQIVLEKMGSVATFVVPEPISPGVADDEEDDYVLATAVAGNATHLVTGDRGLLRLGSYQGVVILTPRDFLDLLTAANSPTST